MHKIWLPFLTLDLVNNGFWTLPRLAGGFCRLRRCICLQKFLCSYRKQTPSARMINDSHLSELHACILVPHTHSVRGIKQFPRYISGGGYAWDVDKLLFEMPDFSLKPVDFDADDVITNWRRDIPYPIAAPIPLFFCDKAMCGGRRHCSRRCNL